MAFTLHTFGHKPHPLQRASLMTTFPSCFSIAGQPNLKHAPHNTQASVIL